MYVELHYVRRSELWSAERPRRQSLWSMVDVVYALLFNQPED